MNRTGSLITLTALGSLLLPACGLGEAARHAGLFGGMTYGHFAYQDLHGGTEPGWGPTFGVFGDLAPFPSDILLLTIEASYLRIGSSEEHHFSPDQPPFDMSLDVQQTTHPAHQESRHYLSAAALLKLTTGGSSVSGHLELGPTINLRFPEESTSPTGLLFGGAYGLGVGVPIGGRCLMLDARYMNHWSSSADDNDIPSTARALMFLAKFDL